MDKRTVYAGKVTAEIGRARGRALHSQKERRGIMPQSLRETR